MLSRHTKHGYQIKVLDIGQWVTIHGKRLKIKRLEQLNVKRGLKLETKQINSHFSEACSYEQLLSDCNVHIYDQVSM